jgi:hypothetical protein
MKVEKVRPLDRGVEVEKNLKQRCGDWTPAPAPHNNEDEVTRNGERKGLQEEQDLGPITKEIKKSDREKNGLEVVPEVVFCRSRPEASLVRVVEPVAVRRVPNDLLKDPEVECMTVKVVVLEDRKNGEHRHVQQTEQPSRGGRAEQRMMGPTA